MWKEVEKVDETEAGAAGSVVGGVV